jgi:multidrug transporter EmrE-like cation transporter
MWIFFFLYLFLNILGLLLLKSGFNEMALSHIAFYESKKLLHTAIQNPKFIFGSLLYALSFLSWLIILSKYQLTYAYPLVVGLSYVGIIVASAIYLHEEIELFKFIGIIFIGIGIIILIRS